MHVYIPVELRLLILERLMPGIDESIVFRTRCDDCDCEDCPYEDCFRKECDCEECDCEHYNEGPLFWYDEHSY